MISKIHKWTLVVVRIEMNKFVATFSIVLFLGLAVSAYSQSKESQNTVSKDSSRGETLYLSKCQFCHGDGGNGNGPAASALNPRPRNFTDPLFWKYTNNEKIAQTIRNGHGRGMPAFTFSPEDIKAIVDYISHLIKSGGK